MWEGNAALWWQCLLPHDILSGSLRLGRSWVPLIVVRCDANVWRTKEPWKAPMKSYHDILGKHLIHEIELGTHFRVITIWLLIQEAEISKVEHGKFLTSSICAFQVRVQSAEGKHNYVQLLLSQIQWCFSKSQIFIVQSVTKNSLSVSIILKWYLPGHRWHYMGQPYGGPHQTRHPNCSALPHMKAWCYTQINYLAGKPIYECEDKNLTPDLIVNATREVSIYGFLGWLSSFQSISTTSACGMIYITYNSIQKKKKTIHLTIT